MHFSKNCIESCLEDPRHVGRVVKVRIEATHIQNPSLVRERGHLESSGRFQDGLSHPKPAVDFPRGVRDGAFLRFSNGIATSRVESVPFDTLRGVEEALLKTNDVEGRRFSV